jgi:hypothetical protein
MSAAQEKQLISKLWEEMCEVYGLVLPKTAQGKKITKDFITSCQKLVNESVAVGNAAQSAEESSSSSSKKKKGKKSQDEEVVPQAAKSKRVKAADEKGEPKSAKSVVIPPKVTKKATAAKKVKIAVESPVPSKKKKASK